MKRATLIVPALACLSGARAHIAFWHNSMFGFNYPYQSDDPNNNNYNNNDPVDPLRESDGLSLDQWFGHGMRGYPPAAGNFAQLPSGGTFTAEVQCNRAGTSWRDPSNTDPLPTYACDTEGPLHVMNRFNATVDPIWFGGTSLAIAYTSDVMALQPNDLTVISVNQNSVWTRNVDYAIPAGMPACPAGGCLCSWNWLHEANHGEGYPFEMYNILFRCQITGQTSTTNKVGRGAVPKDCTNNTAACVTGPKTPMYIYQADGNNLPHLDIPPQYKDTWGFKDGAQNDIFMAAATPAPTTYLSNPYAASTATATASSGAPSATATALPTDWLALGCMIDSGSSRALPNGGYKQDTVNMTISGCIDYCASQNYVYAGVEYGQECWCSNTATLVAANSTDCNSRCAGDPYAFCGGSYRIDVFLKTYTPGEANATTTSPSTSVAATASPTPVGTSQLPPGWTSLGCAVDSNDRVLNRGATSSATNNTVTACIANCAGQGLPYAGLENGNECWCGSTANLTSLGWTGCTTPCTGDASTLCGGAWAIQLYGPSNASATATSTSASASATASSAGLSMANATSASTSTIASSTLASSSSSASVSATPTSSLANSSLAALPSSASSLSSAKSTSASTSPTTSTSAPATPSSTLPAGWSAVGCNIDATGSGRVLSAFTVTMPSSNSPSNCIAQCVAKGYTYAGVEYGNQCYCANAAQLNPTTSGCTYACPGDKASLCGGNYRINVFKYNAPAASSSAASKSSSSSLAATSSSSTSTMASASSSSSSKASSSSSSAPAAVTSSASPSGSSAAQATVTVTVTVTAATCPSPTATVTVTASTCGATSTGKTARRSLGRRTGARQPL